MPFFMATGNVLLGVLLTFFCCFAQGLTPYTELIQSGPSSHEIATQVGAATIEILQQDLGDLNGDGNDEFVAAIETPAIEEEARERLVIIFEKQHGKWILWKSTSAPILNSDDGGFFDPFEEIGIQDQRLHISHYGGSNWRWWRNDTYRYDGLDFVLSAHQSYWGSLCDQKEEWDINLAEGVANCIFSREECPEGFGNNGHVDSIPRSETFEISTEIRITLESRNENVIRLVSPEQGFETSL